MTYAIGSLKIFHDFLEIHEFLTSLSLVYLYQFQGSIISCNSIPLLRVLISHDIKGHSFLDYQKIRWK